MHMMIREVIPGR